MRTRKFFRAMVELNWMSKKIYILKQYVDPEFVEVALLVRNTLRNPSKPSSAALPSLILPQKLDVRGIRTRRQFHGYRIHSD